MGIWPLAQGERAGVYDEGAPGVQKDLKKAAYWSEEAAKQGGVSAQLSTSNFYYYGEGVAKDIHKANA